MDLKSHNNSFLNVSVARVNYEIKIGLFFQFANLLLLLRRIWNSIVKVLLVPNIALKLIILVLKLYTTERWKQNNLEIPI